jgi:cation diffusion facilitator family transporter
MVNGVMKSKAFLYISFAVDVLIAAAKFIAAGITGSSSMLSEGIHSVIDASSQVLLLWGIKTSSRRPDYERPFGYGKELYFWSFIVSLIIFILGGCISFYEGLMRIREPELITSQSWNYFILGFSVVFTSISLFSALKAFNKQRGDKPFFKAVIQSKDPATFIVLLGDVGDVLGLIIAFLGVYFGKLLNNPYYDGLASMAIGVLMVAISLLLVRESKSLLMGETTSRRTLRKIVAIVEADIAIIKVKRHFSMYMAPEEVLLQINAVFKDNLSTRDITDAIERLTKTIQAEFPRIKQIFIEPVAK